jgi:hypothetical protein
VGINGEVGEMAGSGSPDKLVENALGALGQEKREDKSKHIRCTVDIGDLDCSPVDTKYDRVFHLAGEIVKLEN